MTDNLNQEQAPPTQGTGPDCWQLVLADMAERRVAGIAKYDKPLRPDNGRDGLVDAYQELLDLCVYLRQAIEQRKALEAERDTLRAELTRLQAIFDEPRVMVFADGREPTTNERHLFNLLTWAQYEVRKQKEQVAYWQNRCHTASGADEIDRQNEEIAILREAIRDRAGEALGLEQEVRDLTAHNARMFAVLLAWEQWEADWILSDAAWNTADGLPKLTQELYDRMVPGLQQQRNAAKHGE